MTVVAVLQRSTATSREANVAALTAAVADAVARGVDLLVAPEASQAPIPRTLEGARAVAEPLDGPFVEALRRVTTDGGAIVAGMLELGECGAVHNTAVAIDRGDLVASYRKVHLFDAFGGGESTWATPGPPAPVRCEVAGLRVGLLTCYDLRFPELTQLLTAEPLDLLCVPTAWYEGEHKADQLEVLVRARAIEGTCAVAMADQPAPWCCGGSTIVDHRGVVLASYDAAGEGLAIATVDRAAQVDYRDELPVLEHRRFAVVPKEPR